MYLKKRLSGLCAFTLLVGASMSPVVAAEPKVKDIVNTYADIAQATYEDSLRHG